MVQSKINSKVNYSENKEINSTDKGSQVNLFSLKILDNEVIIALGKMDYRYIDNNILFLPIYLVFENIENIVKIGVFEIKSNKYKKYLDENDEIDLGLLDDPVLFSFVNDEYIKKLVDNNEMILDMDDESESEDSDSDDETTGKLKKFVLEEDDDVEIQGETEADIKKIKRNYVKKVGDNWVKTHYHNNNFGLQDNDGGGDCLFYTLRDAFESIDIDMSVDKQRNVIAENIDKKQFEHYKTLYQDMNKSIIDNEKQVLKLKKINKTLKDEYDTILKKLETKTVKRDGKLKKELRKRAMTIAGENRKNKKLIKDAEKENKNSEENMNDFNFMKGVKSLDKLKDIIRTCNFWADTYAINELEMSLNIKVIILSSMFYKRGRNDIVQCGDMVPEKIEKNKKFKPKYYVIVDHTGDHYKLITYKEKKIFRFHEIPYDIKNEIINVCMISKGKNIYNYIPKFNKEIGETKEIAKRDEPKTVGEEIEKKEEDKENLDTEEEMQNEVSVVPTPSPKEDVLYDDNIHFIFKSNSPNVFPGKYSSAKGSKSEWSEKLPMEQKGEYEELSKIKDWRKVLSNFWVAPFKDDEGLQWQTVEHYFHAQKFMKNNREFAELFSLKSGSEICRDPARAKGAGGKKGKYLLKVDGKKKYVKIRPKDVVMEEGFYDSVSGEQSNAEKVMEKGQKFKYEQDELSKKVLLLTKNAKLIHLQTSRGSSSKLIPFYDTMRIRKELMSSNKTVKKPELKIKIK